MAYGEKGTVMFGEFQVVVRNSLTSDRVIERKSSFYSAYHMFRSLVRFTEPYFIELRYMDQFGIFYPIVYRIRLDDRISYKWYNEKPTYLYTGGLF